MILLIHLIGLALGFAWFGKWFAVPALFLCCQHITYPGYFFFGVRIGRVGVRIGRVGAGLHAGRVRR